MAGHGSSLKSLAKQEKPSSASSVALRLAGYLGPYKASLAGGLGWLLVSSGTSAATPYLTGRLIDEAVAASGRGDTSVLVVPGVLLVSATVAGWFASRMQILVLGTSGINALYDLRKDVFAKVSALDIGYFESVESGDLMSRLINDIEQVNSFLSQSLRRLFSSTFALMATLAAMLWVEWRLAVATLLAVPVMLAVTRFFGVVARRAFRRRQESIGDVSATLAEELGGIRVAQAFNRTDRNRTEFASRNAANRDANIGAAAVSSAFSPTLSVISTSATALVVALGGWGAARGLVSIGIVVAFMNYARQFFNAVTQLSSLYSETQAALAGGERVFNLLDTRIDVQDEPQAMPVENVRGAIRLENVHFSYATGSEVLHGIDLDIGAGETVAVVGPTGAGKTTLVNLVPRFYDPVRGRVTLDGRDLRSITLTSLRSHLGIVLQEPFLFSGTVADNIRYGDPQADDAAVVRAAGIAGASAFIEALPEGYDTEVGERGVVLSTGQRQLIAFARAVVGEPRILVLDEATSNVDTRTERLIQQGLRSILEGRTALIIAHRLSTVRDADRIVVVQAGRIVEQGSYSDLMAAEGPFRQLHAAQFSE